MFAVKSDILPHDVYVVTWCVVEGAAPVSASLCGLHWRVETGCAGGQMHHV